MKKFMNLFAILAVAFTLAACGGGGGGTIVDIGATPTPAAHPLLSAPPTATIPVAAQSAVAALRAAPQMMSTSVATPFCGASSYEDAFNQLMSWAEGVPELHAAYFPSHQVNQFDAAPFIYRYYPETGVYAGISTASVAWLQECGVYVMGGSEFGNVPLYIGQITRFITPVGPPSTTYTVQWGSITATITKMGNKVEGANQLPAGCTSTLQQCWRDSVQNGTVKFIETSAVMTGINTRPIVFAYYITADGQRWNTQPFYSDTGAPTVGNGDGNITGGVSSEADWGNGNDAGTIVHERSTSLCFQKKWYPVGDPSGNANVWATEQVACPL